jgi:hypothetical protein
MTSGAPGASAGQVRADEDERPPVRRRRPLYWRLLRLRVLRPNAWQRALLGEGTLLLAVVLVLADLATAWTVLVLPLAVAAMVKVHDVVLGLLLDPAAGATGPDTTRRRPAGDGAGRTGGS